MQTDQVRVRSFVASLVASCFAFGVAAAKPASSAETHLFFGEVQAVDLAAKTFTIKSGGTPLVFHYNDKTKISGSDYVRWDTIKPGQGAAVTMKLGPANIGIATAVRFHATAEYGKTLADFRAKTVGGEIVSGFALANHIAYEAPGERFARATETRPGRTAGIFKLGVRRDGTVGGVLALKSLGNKERDERAAAWLKKWRFRPNSVTEVQIPVVLLRTY